MKKNLKITTVVTVLLLLTASLLFFLTAPFVKKIGYPVTSDEFTFFSSMSYKGEYLEEYRTLYQKRTRNLLQVQFVYRNVPGVQTKANAQEFLIASATDVIQSYKSKSNRKVTVSVIAQRDVYELTITRDNLAAFINIPNTDITYQNKIQVKNALNETMKDTQKRNLFFEKYGRVY